MTTRHFFRPTYIYLMAFVILLVGCKKDDETLQLSRRFAPSTVTGASGETSVTVSWPAALFTNLEAVDYTVEISKDNSFTTVDYTTTTSALSVVVTDEKLAIKQDYYARVKANANDKAADSNWSMSSSFRITGEQFLTTIPSSEIIDVSAILRWRANPNLTSIVLTPAPSGTPITLNLTSGDLSTNSKIATGLTQLTTYNAEIFQGTKSKGVTSFKTKASITGTNIIDLTGTTGNPALLKTTLQSNPPSGTVIILRRGEQYLMDASYAFSTSIKIVSALGFGTNLAIIRPTATFNVTAAANIDSIVFKDVIIKGGRAANASYTNDYVMNVNTASTVKLVRLDGCTIKILRGIVRGQGTGAGSRFNNYVINNCVLDSINDFSVVAVSNTSAFDNIKITNSTFFKSLKFINHGVAAPNGVGSQSVLIENCTFNEVVSNLTANNYLIDYNANNVTGGITIRNCIFGKTWAAGGTFQQLGFRSGTSTGLNIVNTYSTSDFTFTASPLTGTITYSGASTTLFTAPAVGDFTIKDASFAGKLTAGDPRWRPTN